jgi:hypothetical protein
MVLMVTNGPVLDPYGRLVLRHGWRLKRHRLSESALWLGGEQNKPGDGMFPGFNYA